MTKEYLKPAILLVSGFLLSFQNLAFYLDFDFRVISILLVFPFVLIIADPLKKSYRFAIFSLFFLILYPVIKIQSLFFFGFAFYILFIIEYFFGKINNLPVFLVALTSPMSVFIFEITGFPIRLKLTYLAANLLKLMYHETYAQGNLIVISGNEFSVDQACLGLKMIITGLSLILVLMSFFEKKYNTYFKSIQIIWILAIAMVFLILANFLRIIGIVIFKAMPGTTTHELIGILSLFLYVLIPSYFGIKKIICKTTHDKFPDNSANFTRKKYGISVAILIMVLLAGNNYTRDNHRIDYSDEKINSVDIKGYNRQVCKNTVLKFSNKNSLIYVKPAAKFYSADHTPIICWKGSGFTFKKEKTIKVNNNEVFSAELYSGKGKLFTAWWYDNGKEKTISQLYWRSKTIKGDEPFRLINVTSDSKEKLIKECEKILNMDLFSSLENKTKL